MYDPDKPREGWEFSQEEFMEDTEMFADAMYSGDVVYHDVGWGDDNMDFPFIYDQKFIDTLAFIYDLPGTDK